MRTLKLKTFGGDNYLFGIITKLAASNLDTTLTVDYMILFKQSCTTDAFVVFKVTGLASNIYLPMSLGHAEHKSGNMYLHFRTTDREDRNDATRKYQHTTIEIPWQVA